MHSRLSGLPDAANENHPAYLRTAHAEQELACVLYLQAIGNSY
jgi:hypothetical protein